MSLRLLQLELIISSTTLPKLSKVWSVISRAVKDLYFIWQMTYLSWVTAKAVFEYIVHKGDRLSSSSFPLFQFHYGEKVSKPTLTFSVLLLSLCFEGSNFPLLRSKDLWLSQYLSHLSWFLKPIQTGRVVITEGRKRLHQSHWSFTPVTKMKDGIFIAP